jgi:hypothetical protein
VLLYCGVPGPGSGSGALSPLKLGYETRGCPVRDDLGRREW